MPIFPWRRSDLKAPSNKPNKAELAKRGGGGGGGSVDRRLRDSCSPDLNGIFDTMFLGIFVVRQARDLKGVPLHFVE